MLASATVIKGLTGTGRSFSKMAHSCSWQADVVCWQQGSVHATETSSQSCLGILTTLRVGDPKSKAEAEMSFITQHQRSHSITPTGFSWSPRPTLSKCGRELGKGMSTRRQGSTVLILEAGNHKAFLSQLLILVSCRHGYNNAMDKKPYLKI